MNKWEILWIVPYATGLWLVIWTYIVLVINWKRKPAPPKLCKDCRWFQVDERWFTSGYEMRCRHPKLSEEVMVNLVTGELPPYHWDDYRCSFNREEADRCGPLGRYWEAKE